MVPASHPLEGRDFNLFDCPPGALLPDQFGLVENVDGLGHRITNAIADSPVE